ncbi:MAG: hypothetical protein DMF73_18705 [Acidobacteria bacterium]|nr:MAG: hypothetical protein DMF73_18705 [Acidobacteriota bacterium]
MSIDRVNISNQGIDRAQGAQPNELVRNAGKDRQVSTSSDSIALSSKAKDLDRLAKAGTYNVSARDLAQKLIDANKK